MPLGYKDSSLGIIPQEWEIMRLSEAFRIQCGYAFKSELFMKNVGIPLVRISNLPADNKYVDLSDCVYYPTFESIKEQFIIHKNDLLIAMSGATTGKTALYHYSHHAFLNQRVGVFKQISEKICYQYLQAIVESQLFMSRLQPLLIAGAQPNISPNDIENMIFPFPPLVEQQKISEILSTWDKAIEKQTQLIEKLELRKKGLMQQFLTGKKRLPGFSGEWKEVKLGDVAYIVGGGTPDTEVYNYWNGPIPWFTPTEIGEEKYVALSKKTITIDGVNNSSAKILPVGTILFTSRASIGLKAILLREATTNQGFQSLIVNKDYDTEYIYYLLDIIKNELIRKASGSTFLEISSSSMKNVSFEIPGLPEQTAIANVLSLCDTEIFLAKQKLNKFQQQKKGVMQVLLTGKRRVKF